MVLSRQSLKKITVGSKPMILFERKSESFDGLIESVAQPASFDIPLSNVCYRVSVSALPDDNSTVAGLLQRFTMYEFEVKPEGSMLEKGMTYILPLAVNLALSQEFRAVFSPKSTTGRNDVFVRVLTETGKMFDATDFGYHGRLYLEVTPLSFHCYVYPFMSLTQMRIVTKGDPQLSNEEIAILHSQYGIVRNQEGEPSDAVISDNALYLHLDLSNSTRTVGYQSFQNPEGFLHLGKKEIDEKEDFWEKIRSTRNHGDLILYPNHFYLLSTRERVVIPPNVCATMEEYSVGMGEFRSHYAGFFDNGFGNDKGTQGVLEFRSRDLPIRFRDGQPICRMVFYRTDEVPEKLYGVGGNHYTGFGPKLAKNFKNYFDW